MLLLRLRLHPLLPNLLLLSQLLLLLRLLNLLRLQLPSRHLLLPNLLLPSQLPAPLLPLLLPRHKQAAIAIFNKCYKVVPEWLGAPNDLSGCLSRHFHRFDASTRSFPRERTMHTADDRQSHLDYILLYSWDHSCGAGRLRRHRHGL